MRLAVLFWFYKEPALCANRLRVLRRDNPEAAIYGLFGGDPAAAPAFQAALGPYLNDFWTFDEPRDPRWKWYHGDQVIARWFQARGASLPWDTVFVAQWDMLVFGPLAERFRTLRTGEILLSGLRPVREVEGWWWHLRPGSEDRARYERFLAFVRAEHGFREDPLCCEFIVICLPRAFLEPYSQAPEPELGFLEYRIPIYAQILGTPFCTDHPYTPWWGDDPASRTVPLLRRALNSEVCEVPLRAITGNLLRPSGARIFHPVFREYPLSAAGRARRLAREILDEELRPRWWRLQRRWLRRA